MSQEKRKEIKSKLHPRNKNRERYDLDALVTCNPEIKDFIKTNISLNVNIYENRKAMRLDINKRFPTVERNIEGLAIWFLNDKDNTCNIFVTSPKNDFDINTWGHELAHCVYGSWHQ